MIFIHIVRQSANVALVDDQAGWFERVGVGRQHAAMSNQNAVPIKAIARTTPPRQARPTIAA